MIKFNNEIIKLDDIDNNEIYDLNIFVNNNFDYNISFNREDKYNNIEKNNNYKLLLNNNNYKKNLDNIYINKLKSYFLNRNINYIIDDDNYIIINNKINNNENIYYDKKLHIFYYNYIENNNTNKIYPYSIFNLDLEYPNFSMNNILIIHKQLKLINQYLYYMNIHFTNKIKNQEKEIINLKNYNNNKIISSILLFILFQTSYYLFIRY